MDLPLQHCNGNVLKNMRRPGNRDELIALTPKIRAMVPGHRPANDAYYRVSRRDRGGV